MEARLTLVSEVLQAERNKFVGRVERVLGRRRVALGNVLDASS